MEKKFFDGFIKLQKQTDKKVVIIGEGKIGKILHDFCSMDDIRYPIAAFLVDDGYRKQKLYQNLPVYELTEFLEKENVEDYIFMNTVTSKDSTIYKDELFLKGIKNVLDFNDADMALKMAMKYWLRYFESKEIETSSENLIIGDWVFPNPFLSIVNKGVQSAFLTDVRDLVIPVWLNDYSRCEDGPYETDHVRIEENDIVIDCGANIGISTANAVARKCKKVYSIEPMANESLIKCRELYADIMSLHFLGLSDYQGTAEIYINPDASNDNSIYYIQNTLKEKQIVQVTTIDAFCGDEGITDVNFIKFYIDDTECRMLLGAKKTIIQYKPKLAIFPSLPHNTNELKRKIEKIIHGCNKDYVIEYAWNKMFAYIANMS